MTNEIEVIKEKQVDPANIPTIVDQPSVDEHASPRAHPIVLTIAAMSQSITPWGMAPRQRDKELRAFWLSEPWLASVVYSVSIRNASFAWEIIGSDPTKQPPKNTIRLVERILKSSNQGKGWKNLITKTCNDLYTQDNGAFWYLARTTNNPNAPVINIISLDAGACQRTGDPEYPVIYTNRYGVERALHWWEIQTLEEFPSPVESAFDIQVCATSRCLLAAEIIQSIAVHNQEKISGTFTKAIDVISGVTQQNIDDALALAQEQKLNRGLLRYSVPVLIPGVDPTSTISHEHIDLASLPDNFDEDTSYKWYVAQLAAAFGVDYQEIAPLMTGNLGSSQQSEIMHLKTRGKGPALIMGILEDIINGGIIPNNVKFRFLEQDLRSETEKADARFTRSKDRSLRVKSGELTPSAARKLAVAEGDMPQWLADEVDKEEKENPQMLQQQTNQQNSEFGSNQVDGGMQTQNQKMINQKISYGPPSGTVIVPLYQNVDKLKRLQSALGERWIGKAVRMTGPGDFHVTLVHCSLVDQFEFNAAADRLRRTINDYIPQMITISKLSSFDTAEGKVIIGLVDKTPLLDALQKEVLQSLDGFNITLSNFSKSDTWIPHVTLAYVPADVEFEDQDIATIGLIVDEVRFTRSDYYSENTIFPDGIAHAEVVRG